jgi:hypothetical protein
VLVEYKGKATGEGHRLGHQHAPALWQQRIRQQHGAWHRTLAHAMIAVKQNCRAFFIYIPNNVCLTGCSHEARHLHLDNCEDNGR